MNDTPEFSRRIDGLRLAAGGERFELAATAEERAGLAKRFALLTLDRLEAKVKLTPLAGGYYRLAAEFEAELTQACTITLEPLPGRIAEAFTLAYGPTEEGGEIVLDGDAEPVEPLDDGVIDIGEAVAQQLSLALDPFPRAPGTGLDVEAGMTAEAPAESPFAALARLRKPGPT
ncbi:MAG TPA: DUF177 domain-containing protein [Stellaceae bacterium]|jgi:uncharacterized metal-binding protein YceD (DUF177 family)|nr:DUF177 domain-containing protein [Stellaceae bacterium]